MTTAKFHDAISRLLGAKLEKFKGGDLTKTKCTEIYLEIFQVLAEMFERVSAPIDNEAVNYVAQQYYDGVQIINNDVAYELDPNIFDKRAKLSEIPTKELAFLAMLFDGTDFKFPILEEIKKRS